MNAVRVNITIPKHVIDILKHTVAGRGMSRFIAQAIEEKIKREHREKAIKTLAQMPPAFPEIKDAAEYIHTIRREDDKHRLKNLDI